MLVLAAMRPFRSARRRDPIVAFLDRLTDGQLAAVAGAMRDVARGGPGVAPVVGPGLHELLVEADGHPLALLFAESGPDRQVLLAVEDAVRVDAAARLALAGERLADWRARHGRSGAATVGAERDFLAEIVARRSRRDAGFTRLLDPIEASAARARLPRTATHR